MKAKKLDFNFSKILDVSDRGLEYRKLDIDGSIIPDQQDARFFKIDGNLISNIIAKAIYEINHFLRASHLSKLAGILKDPEASRNDIFVAYELLKNINIAAGGIFPMCQDTGTVIVKAKRGSRLISEGDDEKEIARGIFNAYQKHNLRMSQLSPITMFEEINTKTNLPAEIDISYNSENPTEYKFLVIAKGGGSANKSFLFQESPQLLDKQRMLKFIHEKLVSFGTSACPPYHLAIVVGGSSGEFSLKMAKLASCKALDHLPEKGNGLGGAIRDKEMEAEVLELTRKTGIGAQFGGKYFCHDVRVIRLPRHGASLPVSMAVSCSADRQAWVKINPEGAFIERLEHNPSHYLTDITEKKLNLEKPVDIDLNQPMQDVLALLGKYPVKTRVNLSGTVLVARDAAHLRWRNMLEAGKNLPAYCKKHPIYYAGPAKVPDGYASGSFGPTTAGRMDSYVSLLQEKGASLITLAKGNRSRIVRDSLKKYGGFYLSSVGGAAARVGRDCITSVEVLDFEDLGMEAVWKIEVKDFPAFIVIDNKGNDLFEGLE